MNKFNPEGHYSVADGTLTPIYDNFNFHRLELNLKESLPLWNRHTLNARIRAAGILGETVPDFFDYYLGGMIGMKSYPFYAISGNRLLWAELSYRFPLFRNIDWRCGMIYLDKIYMSVYGDVGNAWNGAIPSSKDFKKGAGAEIRLQFDSYYMFPTAVFFNAAYSFDRTSRYIENRDLYVNYGKEWQFYGGVMFDFSL
jgi:outer membrane protein assembly factor BamA